MVERVKKNKSENNVHLHAICRHYSLYSGERRSIIQAIIFGLACLKLIKEDFDIIEVDHMPYFPLFSIKLVCILKRKKMIATWNEVWGKKYWGKYLGYRGTLGFILERLSVKVSDKIISVSSHTTRRLKRDLNSKKEIYTISNGVDLSEINKAAPSDKGSDVIFAGRLLGHKNVDVLIKTIHLVKADFSNIKCLIIGDGPEKNRLEDLTRELKLEKNIKFLGFLENHNEVYSLMKSSKVFVLPSTREGFGIVIIEANACGIPVITTNHKTNAAKDLIIDGKNGYLCALEEKLFADYILRILDNTSTQALQQYCTRSAKEFDWNVTVNKIEEVYKQ